MPDGSRWIVLVRRIGVLGVTGVAALGAATLTLAVAGAARPVPVAALSVVAWAVLIVAWRPGGETRSPEVGGGAEPGRPRPALMVLCLALILASGMANLRYGGLYVLVNRDPGVYVTAGRWIAEEGTLVVDGGVEAAPELNQADGVVASGSGQTETDGDPERIQIQGAHLFPSLLAVGWWVGEATGMVVVAALIGSAGLAAFAWVALRLLPDWVAAVVVAAFAVSFAWLYTVRSFLSEPTLVLFGFGGAALLIEALRSWPQRPARLAVAGFVSSVALAARVDAGVMLMVLPPVLTVLTWRGSGSGRPGRALTWWGLGAFGPAVLAAVDLGLRSPRYLSDLRAEAALVVVGIGAGVALAALVAGAARPKFRPLIDRVAAGLEPRRALLAGATAMAVVVLALFAWFVRPHLGPDRLARPGAAIMESIQVHEGLSADGTRTYAERSVDRVRWYTGPVAVAAGAVGLALAVRALILRPPVTALWVVVGLVVPGLVLYLYSPSIYPDHPWMIRRYVPAAIPGLLLFSGWLMATVRRSPRLSGPLSAALSSVMAVGLLVPPLTMTWPLRAVTWQAGGDAGIARLCDALAPADVVLMSNRGLVGDQLVPSVRAFCGSEVVAVDASIDAPGEQVAVADEVIGIASGYGLTVGVVGSTRQEVHALAPTASELVEVSALQTSAVGTTIGRPPSLVGDMTFGVWVAMVDPSVA